MAHVGQEFRFEPGRFQGGVAGLGQLLFGLLELSDVLGYAECADDFAVLVAKRHLGGQSPGDAAVVPGFLLGPADDRLAGANDELFVVECDLGMFGREKVEVRFTDRFFGILEAEFFAQGLADFGKARLSVLEVNVVGDVVEEGAQQIAFVGQGLLHFPALGHVPKHALDAQDVAQGVVHRCLDDLHVNLAAIGRPMFLDGFKRGARFHHALIVALVFFRELLGE